MQATLTREMYSQLWVELVGVNSGWCLTATLIEIVRTMQYLTRHFSAAEVEKQKQKGLSKLVRSTTLGNSDAMNALVGCDAIALVAMGACTLVPGLVTKYAGNSYLYANLTFGNK
jgi:hypothetical protein